MRYLVMRTSDTGPYGAPSAGACVFWWAAILRTRRHHDRSVPVGLSVGSIPFDQSGYQTSHAFGLERQYPVFHSYQRRQMARSQTMPCLF
jgi:hypothetical protein